MKKQSQINLIFQILKKTYFQDLYQSTNPDVNHIKEYINDTKIDHVLNENEIKQLGGGTHYQRMY